MHHSYNVSLQNKTLGYFSFDINKVWDWEKLEVYSNIN